MLLIPAQALAADTLRALIEEFVSRDGTDYGALELSLAAKAAEVERQLARRQVVILFDPASEQAELVTQEQLRQLRATGAEIIDC